MPQQPLGIVDIGSNSVRLVVYDGLKRAPIPIYNEKALCGLGEGVSATNRLRDDAVEDALAALTRYRLMLDHLGVERVFVLATAAAREADNGPDFTTRAEEILRTEIEVLSGEREAELAALGVISGMTHPNGIVGDMGGGSTELVRVDDRRPARGVTTALGALRLRDDAEKDLKVARALAKERLKPHDDLNLDGKEDFYAVGGTWRSLGRLHMYATVHPLHVAHGYVLPAKTMLRYCEEVISGVPDDTPGLSHISSAREPLLPYGAAVLAQIIERLEPRNVVFSALGVREGKLYELLTDDVARSDALIAGAYDLASLRVRSMAFLDDLLAWVDGFMASADLEEDEELARLRRAACILSDVGWRAHPDYRGEQSLNVVAHAPFIGIDHVGRAFVSYAVLARNEGNGAEKYDAPIAELMDGKMRARALLIGVVLRLAYVLSAGHEGALGSTPLTMDDGELVLTLKGRFRAQKTNRVASRLRAIGKQLSCETRIDA